MIYNSIVLSTHYLVYGAAQALKEYLILNKLSELEFIAHPLNTDALEGTIYESFEKGEKREEIKIKSDGRMAISNYFKAIVRNIRYVYSKKKRYDLYIGVNNLNCFAGIILKKIKRVKKVIYYTIDFTPKRFNNYMLNRLYHLVDSYCVKNADEIWNVSDRIVSGREEYNHLDKVFRAKQTTIPIGIWYEKVDRGAFKNTRKKQLLYLGSLLEKQGVQYVIESIPRIVEKIKNFHFLIIGGGDYFDELVLIVNKLGIKDYVTFTGWVKDRAQLDKMMSDSVLSVAMYKMYEKSGDLSFTYYADPTKLKDYLSAGLPILLTGVPHNAIDIERRRCGKIITLDPEIIAQSVIDILQDEIILKEYRENALSYIKEYRWEVLFDAKFK